MLLQQISDLPAITASDDYYIKIELLDKIKCNKHLSYRISVHIEFLAFIKQSFYCFELQVCFFVCTFGKICFRLCEERFQFFNFSQPFFYGISIIALLRTKTSTTATAKPTEIRTRH